MATDTETAPPAPQTVATETIASTQDVGIATALTVGGDGLAPRWQQLPPAVQHRLSDTARSHTLPPVLQKLDDEGPSWAKRVAAIDCVADQFDLDDELLESLAAVIRR